MTEPVTDPQVLAAFGNQPQTDVPVTSADVLAAFETALGALLIGYCLLILVQRLLNFRRSLVLPRIILLEWVSFSITGLLSLEVWNLI